MPLLWPSSERRAASATAASPGRTSLDGRLLRRAGAGGLVAPAAFAGGGRRSGPGIGVPWGSWLGSPSLAAISSLELLGDVVLEHLGLLVDAVAGHPQRLGEVGLDQAVVADHLERDLLAGRGQADALVGQVVDQAEAGEPFQHRGRRRRRDAEPLGDLAVEDGPVALAGRARRSPWRSPRSPRKI